MKPRRMIPAAAAGVIALTATIAFAQDYTPGEETEGLRIRVSERKLNANSAGVSEQAASLAIDSESGTLYHVEISRGDSSKVVLIEAGTGKVVRNVETPGGKIT